MSTTMPEPAPINISGSLASAIDEATNCQVPLAVAYVDATGRPHLSPRGTVQVNTPDQLVLWARTPGLPDAITVNPYIALLYQDVPNRTFYQLNGRAQRVDDQLLRERIYDNSPPQEQAQDPDRSGIAILVDIDSVRGLGPEGLILMSRSHTEA